MFRFRSGSGHWRAQFPERRGGSPDSRSARHQKTPNSDVEVSSRGISHVQDEGPLRSGAFKQTT